MSKLIMILTGFVAITAIPCGLMMMIKPDGSLIQLDINLINQTFLKNFFVPGLVLTLFAGGVNLIAFIKLWKNDLKCLFWAGAGGIMIILFEIVQISVIKTFYWLQLVYLLCGFFTLLMALQLKHKELI